MKKLISLCLCGILMTVWIPALSQVLSNSGPNNVCGTSASGTLTVSNYATVVRWEEGYLEEIEEGSGVGVFTPVVFYNHISTPTFSYSTTTTKAYRAKLTSTKFSNAIQIRIMPATVAGTIAGTASYYPTGAGTLTLSGHTGQVLKWQKSIDGVLPWTDIAFTGTNYNYSNVTQTTLFRAAVQSQTCAVLTTPPVSIVIYKVGTVTGPTSVPEESKALLTLQDYIGNIKRWEYSTDGGTIWNQVANTSSSYSHNMRQDTKFRAVMNFGSFGTPSTNVIDVTVTPYSQTNPAPALSGQNYVREQSVMISGVTDPAAVDALAVTAKKESLTYLDGSGRAIQQIMRKATPAQKDIIGFSVLDNLGRPSTQYLPYASATDDGVYRTGVVAEQASFYTNGASDKVADSSYPFAKTVTEKSPLGKVLEQGSVGQEWQPGGGHTVLSTYSANDANEVRRFLPDGSSTVFYPENELLKSEITDQDGRKRQTFTDKQGRTILTKVQLDELIGGVNVPWLETYYIYTLQGRLKYVISPKGVDALKSASWSFTASLKDQYLYEFVYDNLGRLVEKKVPGQASVYYCYDRLDRLVLLQDGNIRPLNKWFFVKYDRKGRPVMQGLYVNATHTTRATVQQNVVDPLYSLETDKFFEDRGTASHGYTNQSFPTTGTEILTVNYYDGYDFDFNGSVDYSYTAQSLVGEGTAAAATGLPTGSKRLIIGATTWLYNYVFYDGDGRSIQMRSNNHLSTTIDNLATMVYDFEGKPTLSKNYHNAGSGKITTVINKYEYDHYGRLLKVYQNNNAAPSDQLVAQYEYNALGQLVDKKLHNTTGTIFLQSVDYRYSIQGWLESINNAQFTADGRNDETDDYFGLELLRQTQESGLSNTPLFAGNISAVKWKAPGSAAGTADQQSYKYTYDKADRLKAAVSQLYTGSAWTKEADALNESITSDQNGNILTLQRNQRKHTLSGVVASYTSEAIDNLTYTYSTTQGNQLTKVEDGTGHMAGFNNGSATTTEYTYDITGNLTADKNKGIDSVHYNFLGKVRRIKFADGRITTYVYDAAGTKLTEKNYQGTTLQKTTDYVGSFVYENNALAFFGSPEGRVVKNGSNLEYQYAIADHQGNTRVLFTSVNPTSILNASFEGDASDGSSQLQNVTPSFVVSFGSANHTPGGSKVVRMNQTYKIGPSKSLKVFPGDKVDLEVWEYHEGSSGYGSSSTPLTTLITSVASAFGGVSGGAGETGAIYNGVNSTVAAFGTGGNQGDSRPAAYLNYILFDKDYKVLDAGWQLAPATTFTKQKLSFSTLNIKEAGYVFVYLSYDDASNNWVYFDDLKITHTKSNVIQYNEYYPFGLQTNASWTRENSTNNYLYNAGSELNQASGWYETFYRGYDPALGRFLQVDPLAASQSTLTPYHYAANNPILYNDPNGDRYMIIETFYVTPQNRESLYRASGSGSGGGASGYTGPGSGYYWADGITYDDWSSNHGSETFKALAEANRSGADLELVGNTWYSRNENGDKVAMTSRNGQIGYWEEHQEMYKDPADPNPYAVVAENSVKFVSLQQERSDYDKLNEFGKFFFGNEMNLPNGFKLDIVLDYNSKYTTDVPGRRHAVTIPIMASKTAKMYLNPFLLQDAMNLYIHLGHELVHANDIANGNLTKWLKQYPSDVLNIGEAHAFMWSAAAEAGFGVNYSNSQQNLDYYKSLLPIGFSFDR